MKNEDTELSELAKSMKKKFDKYQGDPAKMNKMIFIECVFDPHLKFDYVAIVLVKMYGEEKGGKHKR